MELERRYHHQLRTTVAIRWLCPKHDRFLVEERGDRTAVSNGEDPIEPTTSVGTTSETGGHIRKCHTDGCRVQSVAKCTFPQGTCFVSHATHETAVLKIRHAVEKLCDKERRNIDRFAHIVETYFKQKQSQTVSQLKTEVVDLRRIVREEEERLAKEQESKNQLEACVKRLRHASGIRQRHLATEEAQLRSHVQALNDLRRRAPTEIAQLQVSILESNVQLCMCITIESIGGIEKRKRCVAATGGRDGCKVSIGCPVFGHDVGVVQDQDCNAEGVTLRPRTNERSTIGKAFQVDAIRRTETLLGTVRCDISMQVIID